MIKKVEVLMKAKLTGILFLGIIVAAFLGLSGCYTQVSTRGDGDYQYAQEGYDNDTTSVGDSNYADNSCCGNEWDDWHHRSMIGFDYYYPGYYWPAFAFSFYDPWFYYSPYWYGYYPQYPYPYNFYGYSGYYPYYGYHGYYHNGNYYYGTGRGFGSTRGLMSTRAIGSSRDVAPVNATSRADRAGYNLPVGSVQGGRAATGVNRAPATSSPRTGVTRQSTAPRRYVPPAATRRAAPSVTGNRGASRYGYSRPAPSQGKSPGYRNAPSGGRGTYSAPRSGGGGYRGGGGGGYRGGGGGGGSHGGGGGGGSRGGGRR